MITIGNAVTDERNKSKDGKAGNQKNELRFQDWYNRSKGWSSVIRCKNDKLREKIADAMELAVKNKHIGYDQNQRMTLMKEAEKVDFAIDNITVDCETDCSALVSVCVLTAIRKTLGSMYTGNELSILKGIDGFYIYKTDEYTKSDAKLKRGDILLGDGHTAIVVNDLYHFSRELSKGSKGDDVKALQTRLNALGYACGSADGEFGTKTHNAVKLAQIAFKLTSDGVVGKNTATALGFIWY